ncbi:TetR/AcrR family transcriptional regulator [Pseudonocardia sp. NPDC049154]|uniref:TetR/AcrR family transcriptional regulator n=1 Tax=Pseudonocardia sp. NPDC049154 TaxID=3155501 RepID=UPI0033C104DF
MGATRPAGDDPRGRRGRTPSPAKQAAILAAATDCFLADGYAGASMDRVAERAGVSKQTVYGHFGGKESLFTASPPPTAARSPRGRRPGPSGLRAVIHPEPLARASGGEPPSRP